MWLVLFMTLAHWTGYELIQRPTPNAQRPTPNSERINKPSNIKHQTSFWWWMFYLSLALGFLAKGPLAWTPPATVAVVIIYTRHWQSVWCFKFVSGILLTIAVVSLWGFSARR